jgi:hypothetical protein
VDDLNRIVASLPNNPLAGEGAQRLETALSTMLVWIGLQGLAALFAGLALVLYPLKPRASSPAETAPAPLNQPR